MSGEHGKRVLVIDDNVDNAETLRMFFRLHGHDAVAAYTGWDGVRLALERVPELVICDIGLPGLSGLGVAEALRRHAATADAYLVAVTGHGAQSVGARCREAGFRRVFLKPFDPNELLPALDDAPRRAPRLPQAAAGPF